MEEKRWYLALGLVIMITSLVLAIMEKKYWFSFLIVSIFFIFDWLDQHFNNHSLIDMLRHRPANVLMLYFWFFLLGMILDVFYGILQGSTHLQFNLLETAVNLWIITYPFAFLASYSLFQVVKHLFKPLSHHSYHVPLTKRSLTVETLLIYGVFFLGIPMLNIFNGAAMNSFLLFVAVFLIIIGVDHYHKKPWHDATLSGFGLGGTVILSSVLIGLLSTGLLIGGAQALFGGALFPTLHLFTLGIPVIIPGWTLYIMLTIALEEVLMGRKY